MGTIVLLLSRLKFLRKVQQVVGINESTAVAFTLVEKVVCSNKLLIKQYHYLIVSAPNHSASQPKRYILTHLGVHIENTVSDLKVSSHARFKW